MNRYLIVASLVFTMVAYFCVGFMFREGICEKILDSVLKKNSQQDVTCNSNWLGGVTIFIANNEAIKFNDFNEMKLSHFEKYFSFPADVYVGKDALKETQPTFRFVIGIDNRVEKTGPHPADM